MPYTAYPIYGPCHQWGDKVQDHWTNQDPATALIMSRRLLPFGRNARADSSQDHPHVLRAATNNNSNNNTHIYMWKRAQDRSVWHQLVEMAMFTEGHATQWWQWLLFSQTVFLRRQRFGQFCSLPPKKPLAIGCQREISYRPTALAVTQPAMSLSQ